MLAMNRREFLQSTGVLLLRPQSLPRITTIAGSGTAGMAPDGEAANRAAINNPYGLVIGPDGNLYWADFGSNRVLRLDLRTKSIGVIAGTGAKGHSGDGGPAKAAQLSAPHEVRFDSKGNLYIDERDNHIVRRVDMKTGIISTVAGTPGKNGYGGDGGSAAKAPLNQPHGITLDRYDNLYISDPLNNRRRR